MVRWMAVFQLPLPLPAHSNHSSTSRLLSGSFVVDIFHVYGFWLAVNLWIPVIIFSVVFEGVKEMSDNVERFVHVSTCEKIPKGLRGHCPLHTNNWTSNVTLISLTVLLKNRDPVLRVDFQVPRLKLFQLAQVNLNKGNKSTRVRKEVHQDNKKNYWHDQGSL